MMLQLSCGRITQPQLQVSSDKQTQFGPEEGGAGCREASFLSLGSPDGRCLQLYLQVSFS